MVKKYRKTFPALTPLYVFHIVSKDADFVALEEFFS